jgi:plastocyanin
VLLALAVAPAAARADPPLPEPGFPAALGADVQHLHFRYGPVHVPAGQNLILIGPVTIEKPAYDGYLTAIRPNMVGADGTPPPTDVVHLHHGVFLNMSRPDATAPQIGGQRFFATGEEKTQMALPYPYGYPVAGSDVWAMNYMLHNETPNEQTVWLTYDIDYVPADTALGHLIKPVEPVWTDVENGRAYPVFDVHRGTGANGRYTYPQDARPDPYANRPRASEWTVPRDMTLVATAGHVHPGGLYTDLDVIRPGATPRTTTVRRVRCRARRRHGTHRARRTHCRRRVRTGIVAGSEPNSVRIFRSRAKYFDPVGPVSWDLAMERTPADWRVHVRKGDRLAVSATYDSSRASWYESMGIDLLYASYGSDGVDPFAARLDQRGTPTHGHLAENDNHGGKDVPGAVDPATQPDGQTVANGVAISGFQYLPGNLGLPGGAGLPPAVQAGDQLQFGNFDAAAQIFHTITACRQPCNKSTGLDYPLADGPVQFDSGNLGHGPQGFTAAAQREDWKTPADLPPGTYTYFCRVHPFMRGAFRVKPR